ncbi:MAG: hypothetical protein H5U40_03605 [Polyangiaceae bacterium]|nr:hypothetical protein [Polyangiaceae bacterium]
MTRQIRGFLERPDGPLTQGDLERAREYELAFLRGGERGAFAAALLGLLRRKALVVVDGRLALGPQSTALRENATYREAAALDETLDGAILASLAEGPAPIDSLRARVRPAIERTKQDLVARGLLRQERSRRLFDALAVSPLVALLFVVIYLGRRHGTEMPWPLLLIAVNGVHARDPLTRKGRLLRAYGLEQIDGLRRGFDPASFDASRLLSEYGFENPAQLGPQLALVASTLSFGLWCGAPGMIGSHAAGAIFLGSLALVFTAVGVALGFAHRRTALGRVAIVAGVAAPILALIVTHFLSRISPGHG